MNIKIDITNLRIDNIFTIAKGRSIVKGGKRVNSAIFQDCGTITDTYFCYCWRDSNVVLYIGSVTKDYKSGQYANNLLGRISNYLQNHSGSTNKMVFDNVNTLLSVSDVQFGLFRFDQLLFEGMHRSYLDCTKTVALMKMLEAILICRYRLVGEAIWNRS